MLYYLLICKYLDTKTFYNFKSVSRYVFYNCNELELKKRKTINLFYSNDTFNNNIKYACFINEFYFYNLEDPIYLYLKNINIDFPNQIVYSKNFEIIKFLQQLNFLINNFFYKQKQNMIDTNIIFKRNKIFLKFNYDKYLFNYQGNLVNKNILIKFIGFKFIRPYKFITQFNLLKVI
tara:strand:- start:302 stop:832 length:531 start_codon:yes stop_codon:yes gene_type:complete